MHDLIQRPERRSRFPFTRLATAGIRTVTVPAGWAIVRQSSGWQRSIPVYRRRRIAFRGRA